MKHAPLRLGVIGLGRAFALMLPAFGQDTRVQMVTAFDPSSAAVQQFELDFGCAAAASAQALCERQDVDVVYIASPHNLHLAHTLLALAHGKHVLVEKPMAHDLAACTAMIDAARLAKRALIVGHSHSFDTPILQTLARLQSGEFGALRMIQSFNHTDYMYRPRRADELDSAQGGGVLFSQAAHQIDIVRLLAGGEVNSVWAHTQQGDSVRAGRMGIGTVPKTEGAYMATLTFQSGAVAQLCYNGYAHFDSDVWMDGRSELGSSTAGRDFAQTVARIQGLSEAQERILKAQRGYGHGPKDKESSQATPIATPIVTSDLTHQHFGPLLLSCEHALLRPTPLGLQIHSHQGVRFEPWPAVAVPRSEVIDELCAVVQQGQPVLHSGEWARAGLAVSLAMLDSAARAQIVQPAYQVAPYAH